jgi:succinate dehydrogenase / fumarate reductase cytochrome b subunit
MAAVTSRWENFKEGVLYRGREGHYAFILHRVSGLAILLFLVIHIVDTSWVAYAPEAYMHAINLYGTLPFLVSEYFLFAAIIYHSINGLNIVIKDTFPNWWNKYLQANSFWKVIGLSALAWLPAAYYVTGNIWTYHLCPLTTGASCGSTTPAPFESLSLTYFIVPAFFIAIAAVLAYGGTFSETLTKKAPRYVSRPGRNLETWSWLFMRWSGALLFVLVWIHVTANALLTGAHHITLEYVDARWSQALTWGSTFMILAFALLHGINGLRAIVNDYLHNPLANQAVNVLILVVWVVVTALGAYAMFSGVQNTA